MLFLKCIVKLNTLIRENNTEATQMESFEMQLYGIPNLLNGIVIAFISQMLQLKKQTIHLIQGILLKH